MRFISSLLWIQQGISKTPTKLKLEKNEMKQIFADLKHKKATKHDQEDDEVENDDQNNKDTDKKYNLDDYDNEGMSIKLFNSFNLIIII